MVCLENEVGSAGREHYVLFIADIYRRISFSPLVENDSCFHVICQITKLIEIIVCSRYIV